MNCSTAEEAPAISPDDADVNALASLLKLYFRELQDPLIPFALYEEFVNAIRELRYCRKGFSYLCSSFHALFRPGLPSRELRLGRIKDLVQALNGPAKPHHDVLEYLMRHLHRVQLQSEVNKMEASNLAIVFGPTICRSPGENTGNLQIMNIPLQNELVELMIETTDWIFDGEAT